MCYRQTDQPTDQRTDIVTYRVACTRLKIQDLILCASAYSFGIITKTKDNNIKDNNANDNNIGDDDAKDHIGDDNADNNIIDDNARA